MVESIVCCGWRVRVVPGPFLLGVDLKVFLMEEVVSIYEASLVLGGGLPYYSAVLDES